MNYDYTLDLYISVLRKQIHYLKEVGGKQYKIFSGERIASEKEGYIYSFECDNELHLGDSFPVRIELKGRKYQGEILSIEGFTLWIATTIDLGENVDVGYLTCEPWNLLDALIKRLYECKDGARNGVSHLLVEEGDTLFKRGEAHKILTGQLAARKNVRSNPITAIWGPPGTGKTYTLSNIALDCVKEKKKVLIVSQSNVSVDGAINKILDIVNNGTNDEFIKNGNILRYGFVKDQSLSQHPTATSFNYVLSKLPDLKRKREKLEEKFKEYRKNGKTTENVEALKEARKELSLRIKYFEKEAVKKAKIVATTASKIAVEKLFYEDTAFDVVIFDEASMAYVPQLIYASSLAKEKFIFLGDFKQLAPIAQGKDDLNTLTRDIYSFLNISDERGNINYHPWLVLLNEQRRMNPVIAEFANRYVYKGMINSAIMQQDQRIKSLTAKGPFPNEAMILMNLSGTYNVAMKNAERSRFNIMSAIISVLTAVECTNNGFEVGIITPYSAQARLIRAMIQDLDASNIECSTIHQFQGSERQVILFDAVESYPGSRAGLLLTSEENNNVQRLVNVAVTRAQAKLITVANCGYWNNLLYGKENTLLELIGYQREYGQEIEEKKLSSCVQHLELRRLKVFIEYQKANRQFETDLKQAKNSVSVVIPKGEVVSSDWVNILCNLSKYGVKILIKAENKSVVPPEFTDQAVISENAIVPITVIDERICWYGMPHMNRDFVVQKTKLKTRNWYAFRIHGEKTTDQITSFAELKSVVENGQKQKIEDMKKLESSGLKEYIESKYKCDDCNAPLTLRKGRKYFCGCTKCKHTEFITTNMVESYILNTRYTCPEHGSSVNAKLSKFGVYGWCMCKHAIELGSM